MSVYINDVYLVKMDKIEFKNFSLGKGLRKNEST